MKPLEKTVTRKLVPQKGLRKTFRGTTRKCENKNLTQFSFQHSF